MEESTIKYISSPEPCKSMAEGNIAQIDKLLKKRYEDYPLRKQSYYDTAKAIRTFTEELIQKTEPRAPTKKESAHLTKIIKHPIFIGGPMKSGTTLMTQLLDNHPELVVIPGDAHYAKRFRKKRWDNVSFIDHWNRVMILISGKQPYWFFGRNEEAYETFVSYQQYYLKREKNQFLSAVKSLYLLVGSPKTKHWVEKTPSNEFHYKQIKHDFPQAQFIHVLRNPLENITSLKKLKNLREWHSTVAYYAAMIKASYYYAKKNKRKNPENYFTISYEKVTTETEKSMKKLCKEIGLAYNKTLLEPTENGKKGIANSMYDKDRVQGKILDKSKSKRWKKELTTNEKRIIVSLLRREGRKGHYFGKEELQYYNLIYRLTLTPFYWLYLLRWRLISK